MPDHEIYRLLDLAATQEDQHEVRAPISLMVTAGARSTHRESLLVLGSAPRTDHEPAARLYDETGRAARELAAHAPLQRTLGATPQPGAVRRGFIFSSLSLCHLSRACVSRFLPDVNRYSIFPDASKAHHTSLSLDSLSGSSADRNRGFLDPGNAGVSVPPPPTPTV